MSDVTVYRGGTVQNLEQVDPASIDEQFISLWLRGKSEKTQRAYLADMSKFYETVGKPLQQVILQDVHTFADALTELKPTSRNRAIAAVKSALSFGLKSGYLSVNVGLLVKLEKLEDTLAELIMSEQAIARLLALESNKRNHAILVLLYRGGLRCAELCSFTWRNLQERDEAGQIAVYGKGSKTRHVLLIEETWQEVMNLKSFIMNDSDYVFQSRQSHFEKTGKNDRRMDESTVFLIVRRAAARAGIAGNVSPHWMRQAHATHALENGAPITLVKETLGHKSIETTAAMKSYCGEQEEVIPKIRKVYRGIIHKAFWRDVPEGTELNHTPMLD
jgi:integrase/recombinase XerD